MHVQSCWFAQLFWRSRCRRSRSFVRSLICRRHVMWQRFIIDVWNSTIVPLERKLQSMTLQTTPKRTRRRCDPAREQSLSTFLDWFHLLLLSLQLMSFLSSVWHRSTLSRQVLLLSLHCFRYQTHSSLAMLRIASRLWVSFLCSKQSRLKLKRNVMPGISIRIEKHGASSIMA